MPSTQPIPTISTLVQAFHAGVRGIEDPTADKVSGSGYDLIAGLGAIMWSRQAQRDRDLFEAIYADTADSDELTDYVEARTGIVRTLDTRGQGTAYLVRPNATYGDDTIWHGTKILVTAPQSLPEAYTVVGDVPVSATALGVSVPIRAAATGTGTAIDTSEQPSTIVIDDPLGDPSWSVSSLRCADGTNFEKAEDYKSRVASEQRDARVGYAAAIVKACRASGALNVAAYSSDFAGPSSDLGMNVVYVGDAEYSTSTALLYACTLALESTRVLGADLQVLAMQRSLLTLAPVLTLWADPGAVDQQAVIRLATGALRGYFAGASRGYGYRLDAMAGAVLSACGGLVQAVDFTGMSDVGVLVSGTFPAILTKYDIDQVSCALVGPS